MRIGQFIQSIDVTAGGTATAFLNTLAALRTRPDLHVHAYTSPPIHGDTAWTQIDARKDSFTLVPGFGRALGPGELGRAVVRGIEAGRHDLMHLHGLWSPDLLAAAQACIRAGVPHVWQPHGMLVREAFAQKKLKKQVFMALGMRRALVASAGLVFVTAEERDHSIVPAPIPAARQHVIPLPVAMPDLVADAAWRARARERFGIPPSAPCIVFMGRLHAVKRIDLALHAAAELRGVHPDLRLLIVGGGEETDTRRLHDLARSLGLADHALFVGWVKGEDKWLALGAGDALTLNSVHENFGYVAPEALCVGTLPVLTSNLALAGEMGAAGVAIVCQPTKESLAAAWTEAIERNRRDPILARGRAWVQAHLSADAVGARLEAVYRGAASGRA